jgi:hypothetical protein
MALTKREIEALEIINEFNAKLRTFITAETEWTGAEVIKTGPTGSHVNTPIGSITGNGTNAKDPGGPVASALGRDVSAIVGQANSLRDVITAWMKIYSRTSRIRLSNTGNLDPAGYTGTYRFTLASREVPAVISGTQTLLNTWGVTSKNEVKRTDVQGLINALQALWISAARDTTTFTFSYNYCHGSCHSSRGRR